MVSEASPQIEMREALFRRSDAARSPLHQQTLKTPKGKRKWKRNRDLAQNDTDLRKGNLLRGMNSYPALPGKAEKKQICRLHTANSRQNDGADSPGRRTKKTLTSADSHLQTLLVAERREIRRRQLFWSNTADICRLARPGPRSGRSAGLPATNSSYGWPHTCFYSQEQGG